MSRKIVPIILCGGAGSRLWPASRESFPKQLISFDGGLSLLQATIQRVADEAFAEPIIITNIETRFLVAEQLRALNIEGSIVLEPMRRDSCAAIAAGAAIAFRQDPDAVVLVLAADHAVSDNAMFRSAVQEARDAAELGHIVTFGIIPHSPATGYGYIRKGAPLDGAENVFAVERFVEKPDAQTAQTLIETGHLWNSGNFLFKASAFLDELKLLAPEISVAVTAAVASAKSDLDFLRLDPEQFAKCPAISVDYAVMEKTRHAAVLPSSFPWSDIGSWSAVWDISAKDDQGNAGLGDAVFEASSNSYVYSPELLTTLHGVDGLVVIATRDALLVTTKDQSQEIKSLVKRLSNANRREATEHLKNYRPWGNYEQIDHGKRYQVKRITVKPGGILSLQSHLHRAEHWVVVSGTARVTVDKSVTILGENQSVYIPLGAVHRMENPGQIPLELIEVQSGSYLGEDDIVRYEDIYNRS